MSSANKKNKGSLEDVFRHRMQGAEATPAPDLWARIDHDLTVQENGHYKKRIVYYRQLAAACFVLFVMAGAILTYQFNTSELKEEGVAIEGGSGKLSSVAQASEQGKDTDPFPSTSDSPDRTSVTSVETNRERNIALSRVTEENITSKAIAVERQIQHTIASAAAESNKSDTDILLTKNTGTEQTAAGSSDEQNKQATPFVAGQSILLKDPAVLSLMAKEQQKAGELAPDAKGDAKKIAEALALELNADLKTNKKSGGTADSRWSMNMAYTPAYFSQNIGLPDQMVNTINQNSFAKFSGPIISAETSANMEKARDEYEDNTVPAFSYAVEVKSGFKLGRKLKLLAGFGFSQNTARTNTSYVVEQFWTNPQTNRKVEMTPSTIFLPSLNNSFTTDSFSVSQTDPFEVNYRYRMLSLPIGLQFENDIMNGWNWYMTGGVAANIMLESTVTSSRDEVLSVSYDHQDDSPFRRTQFSGNIGAGVSKQVSDAFTVALGPEFRGYFNTMLSDPDKAIATQGKPYAIGVNMSLIYQLGGLKK